ncbi:LysR family transcriptional regulator [Cupriavidus sp. CV2]|uniref:LysR family transcriptional regulator n=1 Tax=Cupriavidus ulmosensis TaxID=3065913 RepID=UPI00296B23DA|nr:LysR family transcriptional regulator [Cupriavidus sp. CV2]MDW3686829.1 LysR family transcriptional regulator [Cupriavidus sp. CV2]
MSRLDVNRSGEMEVFVRVVELGGFSAAARALRMTPSAVSKLVARLETRLGARLVNRSTRRIELTAEGSAFYERAVRVLADLDDAERGAAASAAPHGRVRINANVPFGDHFLLPLVPAFLALYPDIQLDIVLTDQVIDLMEERTDVAIRAGALKSSQLVARKLGETRMVVVGAPAYLARCGTPRVPADLAGHNCLKLGYARAIEGWPMQEDGQPTMVAPIGNAMTSNGDALRRIVVGGLGLARMAVFQVREDIAAGRLVPLLEAFNPGDLEAVHAVYLGQGRHLPARVRALLDFLAERVEMG